VRQERLPKDELEAAVLAQMNQVYADTSLVAAALEEAQAETRARDAERSAEHDRLQPTRPSCAQGRSLTSLASKLGNCALPYSRTASLRSKTELAAVEAALGAATCRTTQPRAKSTLASCPGPSARRWEKSLAKHLSTSDQGTPQSPDPGDPGGVAMDIRPPTGCRRRGFA